MILEPKKIKSVTASTFSSSICHEVMGLDAMILVYWMLNFKPAFSLSSFTLIIRLFISYLLSAIRVVSSAYPRLLTFLPAILILACDSSSQRSAWWTLHVIYLLPNLINSKLGKEYVKAVYCHPACLTYIQGTSCKMPGWMMTSWNQDCQEKY